MAAPPGGADAPRVGREAEAAEQEALARRLRSGSPDQDDLLFDAFMAQLRGEHEQAVTRYTAVLAQRPNAPDFYRSRGESQLALGQLERATEDLRMATAMSPGDVYLHFQLWRVLEQRGLGEEAEAQLAQALARDGDAAVVHEAAADAHLQWGQRAVAARDPARARSHFEQAERHARSSLVREPDRPRARVSLGASLMEQHRLAAARDPLRVEEALSHYRRALELWRASPAVARGEAHATALANTCDAEIQMGDLDRALDVCLEVTRVAPRSALGYYNLAAAYALRGRADQALAALARDVDLGDRDWEYLASDPWFESLRGDPRFVLLVERMKGADAPH